MTATLNQWFADPRTSYAEECSFEAERYERRGMRSHARALWWKAAQAFADVAAEVPLSHPHTKRDLYEASEVCGKRADGCGEED